MEEPISDAVIDQVIENLTIKEPVIPVNEKARRVRKIPKTLKPIPIPKLKTKNVPYEDAIAEDEDKYLEFLSAEEEQTLFIEAFKSAKKALIKEYMTKHLKAQIIDKPHLISKDPRFIKTMKRLHDPTNEGGKYGAKKYPYVVITVNPDSSNQKIDKLVPLIDRFLKLEYIDSFKFVFEQRGKTEEEMGKGVHCHMLIPRQRVPQSHLERDAKRIFVSICDVDNWHCLNFKYINDEDENLAKVVDYMMGKKNTEKMASVKIDKIWRKKLGLEEFYGSLNHGKEEDIDEESAFKDEFGSDGESSESGEDEPQDDSDSDDGSVEQFNIK